MTRYCRVCDEDREAGKHDHGGLYCLTCLWPLTKPTSSPYDRDQNGDLKAKEDIRMIEEQGAPREAEAQEDVGHA